MDPGGTLDEHGWATASGQIDLADKTAKVRCGHFAVQAEGDGRTIHIRSASGQLIQTIQFAQDGSFSFDLDTGPLFGLGQGGPQFDRRGSFDRMRSGQGGYELATHGSRVPIPWLIGTGGGWALFVHTPVGAFDLSGAKGRFVSEKPDAPIDLFVVAAREPAAVMRAYARITGLPEMPPLWSFGYQQSHRTLGSPKDGAILPLEPIHQNLTEQNDEPTELRVHAGADGRFTLYEDDGATFDYKRGRFRLTELHWNDAARRLTVSPGAGASDPPPPEPRRFVARLAGASHPVDIAYDGRRPVTVTL